MGEALLLSSFLASSINQFSFLSAGIPLQDSLSEITSPRTYLIQLSTVFSTFYFSTFSCLSFYFFCFVFSFFCFSSSEELSGSGSISKMFFACIFDLLMWYFCNFEIISFYLYFCISSKKDIYFICIFLCCLSIRIWNF